MTGPALTEIEIGADPAAWREAGFEVSPDGTALVGGVLLRLRGGAGGIVSWALTGVGTADLDGLPTRSGEPISDEDAAHPNGAVAVDHLVVMTPDLDRTLVALEGAGFDLRRTRDAGGGATQAFYRVGAAVLEVVGPVPPAGPARFWGLVFVVEDIDQAAGLLGDRLGAVKDAVQPGRRIATVRESAGLGVPVALITPRPPRK